MNNDALVHVRQTMLLMDAKPPVQTPEGVNAEGWLQPKAMDSTVSFTIYTIYESMFSLITNNYLYVEGEKRSELPQYLTCERGLPFLFAPSPDTVHAPSALSSRSQLQQ